MGRLLAGAIDEVELGAHEEHFGDHRVVIPQRMPADRQVDQRRLEKRHGHLAVVLDDGQAIDLVRTAPQRQIDICQLTAVVAHVGKLVVKVVAHQHWQGQVQGQQ
ncbi:hypothetical protein D3C72_2248880 [compost metagenome]